ncbi:glycosyltransferase family 2 protein [Polluticoccus soli]|uniref:glycosyltransferase family 2 protein n=1 Tax=Polluticoccus soli TaxID=3034150 RepID=UPI0023E262FF|nr:glycosyltransferase family 2 protein [Flavipsychrobacter sp. JY13-12]
MITCAQDTAVVILSYNGKKWHELFLPMIVAEAGTGYEVIVADNASTDDTLAWVNDNYPTVKTVQIPINRGFANGYHEALKQIQAKYYVLLSADFEVTPGWFPPLINAMQRYTGLAACQPRIRYWREREYLEYAGAGGGFMDKYGYMFCRGRMFSDLEKDEGQYSDDIEVFWASGGCMMIRADLYHKIGGLDNDFYAHMEEIDLCWRLKNAGYKIGYIGQSLVYHVGGSVISYGSPQKLFYNFRNNLILLTKNEKASKLLWLFPMRLVLDGIAGLRLLLTGQFIGTWTILRAHFNFYGSLGKWLKRRRECSKHITHRNEEGIYNRSIVWDYFVLRKKVFPKLKWTPKPLS